MSKRLVTLCVAFAIAAAITAVLVWRRGGFHVMPAVSATPAPMAQAPAAAAPASAESVTSPTAPSVGGSAAAGSATIPTGAADSVAASTTQPTSGVTANADAAQKKPTPADEAAAKATPASAPADEGATMVRISEVDGTHRMIEAHAPLRSPEVANPDSTGNRRILQTMLSKAIIRRDTNAATAAAKQGN